MSAWQQADAENEGPRLFVAVPVASEAVEAVAALVAALPEPSGRPVRWVRLDGLHLTLRFLGPTAEERVGELASIVDAVAAGAAPFRVTIGGAGAFPSPVRPRALWLGVLEGTDALGALSGELDRRLVAAGWPGDARPFRPHLTLARSDGVRAGAATARELIRAAATFRVETWADRVVLFESRTGGGPARYVAVHEATLGAPAGLRGSVPEG